MGSEIRKKNNIVRVRVSDPEKAEIQKLAEMCDLSVPAYMRQTALGYTPRSNIDAQHRLTVAKLQADIGRIGGLLKLWLTTDNKKQQAFSIEIPKLINELKATQATIINEYEQLRIKK